MSNPRACDMMTDAFPGWFSSHRKCKQKANLGSPAAPRPRQRDRTGRNMAERHTERIPEQAGSPTKFHRVEVATTDEQDTSE